MDLSKELVNLSLKTKKENKNIDTGDSRHIYQNELDKACIWHHMAYGDFKNLLTRTTSDKALHDKALNIAKNLNIMDMSVDLPQ